MSTETITRVEPPHPTEFYIYDTINRDFRTVKGHSVTVPGMEAIDTFVHETPYGLTISEGKTGARYICRGGVTVDQLIAVCAEKFTTLEQRGYPPAEQSIAEYVEKYGLSPRWTP